MNEFYWQAAHVILGAVGASPTVSEGAASLIANDPAPSQTVELLSRN
jgi:hypothetical protein